MSVKPQRILERLAAGGRRRAQFGSTACETRLPSGFHSQFERGGHPRRLGGGGDRRIHQHRVCAHLHRGGGVRGHPEAGVDDDGHGGLFDDDRDRRFHPQASARDDRRGERHEAGGNADLFKALRQNGVGVHVRQHRETFGDELFARFERVYRVGHEEARVGDDLDLDPRR